MQDKLQKLQNRAACVLTYSNYDADVNNLFELSGWKSLVSQRQIERATIVFKSLQGLVPDYLCSKFVHRDSGCCLRDSVNNVPVNSKTAHATPPPAQTPRHLTFLKNFGQIPRYVACLDGQMPHLLELQRGSNACGSCFLHFSSVLKCPECLITV